MNLSIRSRGMALTPALLDHVERRLRFALSRFGSRLGDVAVRVANDDGARGDAARRCTILLRVHGARPVLVETVDPDLYAAIDRAAARAGRTAARSIARSDELRA
ncbi:MAG TPA: HPF/RaiA family ribosome-associated protein [Candidatus Binatia bacterium]|nr:HPF/RaiA family ribosome-associated protein [Candidatus Binatia bacterium]